MVGRFVFKMLDTNTGYVYKYDWHSNIEGDQRFWVKPSCCHGNQPIVVISTKCYIVDLSKLSKKVHTGYLVSRDESYLANRKLHLCGAYCFLKAVLHSRRSELISLSNQS